MTNEASKTLPLAQVGQDEEMVTIHKSTLLAALGGQKGADEKLLSAAESGDVSLMTTALAAGANPNHEDEIGQTALHLAAYGGHTESIKVLLAAGANVHHEDIDGWTALDAASSEGQAEPIKALLAAGANPNHEDKYDRIALDRVKAIGDCKDAFEILEAATRDAKAKRDAAQKPNGLSGTFTDSTQAGATTSQSGGQNPGIKQQAISPKLVA